MQMKRVFTGKLTESKNDVTVTAISRFPDVYTVSKAPENEEEITADVLEAANTAIDGFIAMREAEGEKNESRYSWQSGSYTCYR